jgi:hypothetical protein
MVFEYTDKTTNSVHRFPHGMSVPALTLGLFAICKKDITTTEFSTATPNGSRRAHHAGG